VLTVNRCQTRCETTIPKSVNGNFALREFIFSRDRVSQLSASLSSLISGMGGAVYVKEKR
jgi:hypothetical protein